MPPPQESGVHDYPESKDEPEEEGNPMPVPTLSSKNDATIGGDWQAFSNYAYYINIANELAAPYKNMA